MVMGIAAHLTSLINLIFFCLEIDDSTKSNKRNNPETSGQDLETSAKN